MVHEDLLKSRLRTSCRAKEQIIFERGKNGGGRGHFLKVEERVVFRDFIWVPRSCERSAGKQVSVGMPIDQIGECNLILSNICD